MIQRASFLKVAAIGRESSDLIKRILTLEDELSRTAAFRYTSEWVNGKNTCHFFEILQQTKKFYARLNKDVQFMV